jgi:glucokinase
MNWPPQALALGIDIGGTKVAAGLVDQSGRLHHHLQTPTPAQEGPDAILEAALGAAREVLSRTGRTVLSCGVATAGTVDQTGHILTATALLRDWAGTDVGGYLRNALDLPVTVRNDVHAAGLAEARVGAARGARTALMIAIGTGIGGAILVNGNVENGRTGTAGSLGHMPAPSSSGRLCSCGAPDHLEALASGPAIEDAYQSRTGRKLDLRAIGALASEGSQFAQDVLTAAGTMVGRVLAGAANAIDPDVVVIGGGVSKLGALLMDPMTRVYRREALPGPATCRIEIAALGPHSGLVGAALDAIAHDGRDRASPGWAWPRRSRNNASPPDALETR